MKQSDAIKYYLNRNVAQELVRVSSGREVAVQFVGNVYGKRPEILEYPKDIQQFARQGATSFHISQERWFDPLQLSQETTKRQMNLLRKGWDFVIDIDCPWLHYSTLAAETVLEALKFHNTKAAIKFSGNRGWHIAIPFEAFPEKLGKRSSKLLFPEASTAMIGYVRTFIKDRLWDKIKEHEGDVKKIVEKTGKKKSEFMKDGEVDACALIDLDLALGAPRHLIRAPYSLHEKNGLVSLPIRAKDLHEFKTDWAKPDNIEEINDSFFNPKKFKAGEASQLLIQALDWQEQEEQPESKGTGQMIVIEGKIPKARFPPCIKNILRGMQDGKKRSLFVLLNFLKNMNWTWDEIVAEVNSWNERNAEPLKQGYILSQLSWHKRHPQRVPPPNCPPKGLLYYTDTGTCKPDNICKRIRNPLGYVKFRRS